MIDRDKTFDQVLKELGLFNERFDKFVDKMHEKKKQNNSDMKEGKQIVVYSSNNNRFLKQAFLCTLEEDGYNINGNVNYDDFYILLVFSNNFIYVESYNDTRFHINSVFSSLENEYDLETKWGKALAKVKKVYKFYNQPTYKVGDRFKSKLKGEEYILACVYGDGVYNYLNLISLEDGNRWSDVVRVKDISNISEDVIRELDKSNYLKKIDE